MNLFARLKLMHRFMIVVGIFAIGFFVYGGWSFKTLNELKVNGPMYQQIVQGKDLIADVLPPPEYILESYLVVFQMRSSTVPDEQARLAERLGVLKKDYEARHDFWKSQGLSLDLADPLLVKSYEPATAFYRIALNEFIPALQKGDAAAADTAMGKMKDAYSLHRSAIDEVVQLTTARNEAGEKEAADRIQSGMVTMLIILACSLVVGISVAVTVIRSLLRQLGGEPDHAAEVARNIASGNLTMPIKVRAGDDQSMIAAMRTMQDMLSRTVAEIKTSVDSVTAASSQIASGNMDLSSRTEQQASSLEETASSMEELTSTVKQNADNARQANQLAVSASGVAVKGGDVVAQVVTTMGSINESARKIVDIIGVIDGIAFQTNILALNAAVEAARAGEQGRGFAVVASEVRNLAQRSAAAAKEIKSLIGDSVEKVDAGSKLVNEAGSTMDEIVDSVKRVTDIMAEIMAASQEQSAGIEQVNQAIGQMDQVTQQNAALVEEAAAAAEALQGQATSLAQVVGIFQTEGMAKAH